jgi:tetratricopeptide (TPR) repeat protein
MDATTSNSAAGARPIPRWIQAAAVVVLAVILIALIQFPAALSGAIAFERGQRAEANASYDVALAEYSKAAAQFPDSTLVTVRKGMAAYHARQYAVAADTFNSIAGRQTSRAMAQEVNGAIDQMSRDASATRQKR